MKMREWFKRDWVMLFPLAPLLIGLVFVMLAFVGPSVHAAGDTIDGSESGRRTFIQTGIDVTASSGSFAEMDIEDGKNCFFVADLTSLAGGTSPTVQISLSGKVASTSTLFNLRNIGGVKNSASGDAVAIVDTDIYPRFLRMAWVTTGSPTTALMDIHMTCTR